MTTETHTLPITYTPEDDSAPSVPCRIIDKLDDQTLGAVYRIETEDGRTIEAFRDEIDGFDMEGFITGYIDAGLWADAIPTEAETDPEGFQSGGLSHLTVPIRVRAQLANDCTEFVDYNLHLLVPFCEALGPWVGTDDRGYCEDPAEARAGHDFWLTRQGHGTGFWDRGLGEIGDKLTDACKSYGEAPMLFETHDGEVTL